MGDDRVMLTARIPVDLHTRVKVAAAKRRESVTELVTLALERELTARQAEDVADRAGGSPG